MGAVLEGLEADKIRGEFTLVVAGREKDEDEDLMDKETQKKIEKLLKERNMSIKDIARQIAEEEGLTYRRLYRECLSIKRTIGT